MKSPIIAKPKRGRPFFTPLQRWERDVRKIQATLEKIRNLNPISGGKWRRGMILHYEAVLEEMVSVKPE